MKGHIQVRGFHHQFTNSLIHNNSWEERHEALSATAIIGLIGVAVATTGTAIQVYSSIKQQEAASDAAKDEAAARDVEAASIRESAAYEERQFRRRAALLLGKQNVITAASGLDVSGGSPLLMELDTIQQTELEALNIRRSGNVTASSREFEAGLSRRRAGFYSSNIGPMAAGGAAKVGGSVLSSWYSYNKQAKSLNPDWMTGYPDPRN